MVASDNDPELNRELMSALDKAIEEGPWEKGLFFQTIGKKLRELRERFLNDLDLGEAGGEISHAMNVADRVAQRAGQAEVYISLYIAEGNNIKKWESVLSALAGHSISRPVYKNEKDVRDSIRAKDFKLNDAYVAVYIAEEELVKPFNGKQPIDRFGRELLILHQGAVRLENITRFVHQSGVYKFENGLLKKQSSTEVL